MKELSIEEKARRYDGAIKRLEDIETGKCQKTFMFTEGLFDYIFPELKESEDERIRKEIIAHIKWCEDSGYCAKEEMTRWITFLEKQGQKPFGFNNSDTIDHNLNDYCCKIYSALHKENGGVLSFARLQHLAMDIYGWCKEQFEHKPTDKVEPKFHEGDIIIHKELGGDYIHNPHKIIQVDILDKKYRLEGGLVAHFGEQEDYELVERKPAWSEADENHVKSILSTIECCKARFPNAHAVVEAYNADIDWLKSLRHRLQWKPSDEHIHWLKWATNRMPDTEKANEAEAVLEELLEELKKLTGE